VTLGPVTATIVRPPARDWQGDRAGSATETDIDGCSWQPGASSETLAGGDTVITSGTVFMPGNPDIQATDQVRVSGVLYAVAGTPAAWQDDVGAPVHTEAQLRLTGGS
jgi:hypothetical protein